MVEKDTTGNNNDPTESASGFFNNEKSKSTKSTVIVLDQQAILPVFIKEFFDYYGNYCSSIESKFYRTFDDRIMPFSEYVKNKYTVGSGHLETGKIIASSELMHNFEQAIVSLFSMPRSTENEIKAQKTMYGTIYKEFDDPSLWWEKSVLCNNSLLQKESDTSNNTYKKTIQYYYPEKGSYCREKQYHLDLIIDALPDMNLSEKKNVDDVINALEHCVIGFRKSLLQIYGHYGPQTQLGLCGLAAHYCEEKLRHGAGVIVLPITNSFLSQDVDERDKDIVSHAFIVLIDTNHNGSMFIIDPTRGQFNSKQLIAEKSNPLCKLLTCAHGHVRASALIEKGYLQCNEQIIKAYFYALGLGKPKNSSYTHYIENLPTLEDYKEELVLQNNFQKKYSLEELGL